MLRVVVEEGGRPWMDILSKKTAKQIYKMESESGKKQREKCTNTSGTFPWQKSGEAEGGLDLGDKQRLDLVDKQFFFLSVINNAREEKICCEYCSGDTNEKVLSKCSLVK